MGVIPGDVKAILDDPVFVHVATINEDTSPQVSVVWLERDGDLLRFSTVADRVKHRNLMRDPRLALSFSPLEDPYRNITIRGRAVAIEARGAGLIDRMARKYLGSERYEWSEPGQVRIDVDIEVERVTG